MKLVTKNNTKEFTNGNACTAFEYPLDDNDINVAVIKLTGRYPENGRVMNIACKEIAYVINGEGNLFVEGKNHRLSQGDVVLIETGEKYYWEGNPTLFIPSVPPWHPDQHKQVA